MKVIDLINKKYQNEKLPKTIVINRLQYEYNEEYETYKSYYGEYMSFDFTNNVLNMEVEVIEEDKTIEEFDFDYNAEKLADIIIQMKQKINELVKEIKKLKEN